MKSLLAYLRSRPRSTRVMIALVGAVVLTAAVAIFGGREWFEKKSQPVVQGPSSWSILIGNLKQVWQSSKKTANRQIVGSQESSVQVSQ
jgi:hypothetical protein